MPLREAPVHEPIDARRNPSIREISPGLRTALDAWGESMQREYFSVKPKLGKTALLGETIEPPVTPRTVDDEADRPTEEDIIQSRLKSERASLSTKLDKEPLLPSIREAYEQAIEDIDAQLSEPEADQTPPV